MLTIKIHAFSMRLLQDSRLGTNDEKAVFFVEPLLKHWIQCKERGNCHPTFSKYQHNLHSQVAADEQKLVAQMARDNKVKAFEAMRESKWPCQN